MPTHAGDFRKTRVPAIEQDWDTEYLDLILSIKVVDSIDEAIDFVARHGSGNGRRNRYRRPVGGDAL